MLYKLKIVKRLFGSDPRAHRLLLVMLLSVVPIVLINAGGDGLAVVFEFHRDRIAEGQWWRLYSGNWVHFGWQHTSMNFVGMCAIALLVFWPRHIHQWWFALAIIPWGVGLGLYFFDADTYIYRGFSGAAYGFLILGFMLEWRHSRIVMSVAMTILLGKIFYEQLPDYDVDYLQDQIGVAVATAAHFWGVVTGVILAVLIALVNFFGNKKHVINRVK